MPEQFAEPVFVVQLNIDAEQESDWNRWYDEVHVPEVMAASDEIISATRYRLTEGTTPWKYLAIYRFRDVASLERFIASPELAAMGREYDEGWGRFGPRQRGAYVPILHRDR